jgi:predicted kinase
MVYAGQERFREEAGVPFAGFWLEAPEAALVARVEARRYDPSDADSIVIGRQRG